MIATQARPALAVRKQWLNRTQRSTLWRGLAMGFYTLITVFPFYWMLVTVFKANGDLYNLANNPLWFNQAPTLANIVYLFEQTRFTTWMLNSLTIGVAVVAITLAVAVPAGYALARLRLPGRTQLPPLAALRPTTTSSQPTAPSRSARLPRWSPPPTTRTRFTALPIRA